MRSKAEAGSDLSRELVGLAAKAIAADKVSSSSNALLGQVLSKAGMTEILNPLGTESFPSPAAIFDAFAPGGVPALRRHFGQFFEVVAMPGEKFNGNFQPGDLLVRRAWGEGGMAHVALLVTGEALQAKELASLGLRPESRRPGLYAEVIDAGPFPHRLGDKFARRLGNENGQLGHDSLILRVRHDAVNSLRPLAPTLEEQGTQQPTAAGESAENAPPSAVSSWPLGVDLYQGNRIDAAGFKNLKNRGKTFAIAKSSQGTMTDGGFRNYYRWIRESGMIRGSYHFFANKWGGVPQPWLHGSIADQANVVVSLVNRLGPGDLAPALDLEDEPRLPTGGAVPAGSPPGTGRYPLDQGITNAQQGYHYRRTVYANWQVGRDELLADIQDFLDRIETALGRTPLIYTSHMWRDTDMMNNPQVLSQYPLWTVYHGEPDLRGIRVGAWGRNWAFIQYAEQGERYWGLNPYTEPNIDVAGIDFDAYNGTIYGLRGLADLGHTAPHLVGNQECIAYTEADGRVHLLELVAGTWRDQDLSTIIPSAPIAVGDPAAIGIGSEQIILYRTSKGNIHALARSLTNVNALWSELATGPAAIDDPFVTLVQNNVHVVYWNEFNRHIHLSRQGGGTWDATHTADLAAIPSTPYASGSAVAYLHQNVLHFVSRAGGDGHLIDSYRAGAGGSSDNLTATARDNAGHPPPAATYRPATYTPTGRVARIVFRAVRGDIWQIERDTLNATNLRATAVDASNAGGVAPAAVGSPTAIFVGVPHIFYRTVTGRIIDLFGDINNLRWREVCIDAAADPTAFVDRLGHAAVSFRAIDGTIRVARFVNGTWMCENATRPQSGGSGESAQGGPEAAVTQRTWEDAPLTPVLHLEKLKISGLPEIILMPGSGRRYEGFFATPIHLRRDQTSYAQSSQKEIEITGRIQMEEAGTRRNYDRKKDGTDWPLGGSEGSAPVKAVSADGPSSSTAFTSKVRPDGTFTFSTRIGVDGYTRSLTIYPKVELKGGKTVSATIVLELLDLDGFLALVDPKEKVRPASQTHLEFLASVRKIYQGGPNDPLSGAFDWVVYRNRKVKPLVAPGTAEDQRFQLYKNWVFADREWVDIGHVLTGIEGSPKQEPSKDQSVPLPRRPELLVTWAGDLGSALQAYIKDFWNAIDTGAPLDLNEYLRKRASQFDLTGDIDGINIGSVYDASRSLAGNLRAYYGQKSRRRYHEFIANSKDENGKAELPLVAGKKPPQLSKQARQAIAVNTREFLVPLWIYGKLYGGADPAKRKLIDEIMKVDSPEMDMVVEYFVRFLEDGLAREP